MKLWPLPFGGFGLRGRLLASHVVVVVLCLAISGGIFVLLLRGYRQQLAERRLDDLVYPVAIQVSALDRSAVSTPQIATFLQDQAQSLHTRILLLDATNTVVADSDGRLTGRVVVLHITSVVGERHPRGYGLVELPGSGAYYFVAAPMPHVTSNVPTTMLAPTGTPVPGAPEVRESSFAQVVLAAPRSGMLTAWRELLPSLLLAGVGSLLFSVVVSFLLSKSIAGPLGQMTRATEEMARGELSQALPVNRRDEIGRLAMAFNVMAAQVNASQRLLRDFVANVSHELRTPLTSVQGFAQAIADGVARSPEDISESARIILHEADRMHRLVDDLLYLSKLESGQLPIEVAPMDAAELVDVALRRIEKQAAEAHVRLVKRVEALPQVMADSRRIEQVLTNLLDNALLHTPPDGVITLSAEAKLSGGKQNGRQVRRAKGVVIGVHNTGSYIPDDERRRIFERFYQVDKSRARDRAGAGLGLAICYEIAMAHGGTLRVESDSRTGTRFSLELRTPLESSCGPTRKAVTADPESKGEPTVRVSTS